MLKSVSARASHIIRVLRNTRICSPETQDVTTARPLSKCYKQKNATTL